MSRILITGASGFLGTKLYDVYSSSPRNVVVGTYKSHPRDGLFFLDVTDAAQTHKLILTFRPDIVIHTVALSDADICEQKKEDAEKINYFGTKNIVEAARVVGARLDYISTAYVFDGAKGNYTEDDKTNPINWYGQTKLMAEREVSELTQFGIYRFDKLYGYNGSGKPNDAFSKIEQNKPFAVNSDQIRQPLLIDDVVRTLQFVQRKSINGIFHLAGPERLSKYELTIQLARLLGKEKLVVPIPEKEQIARRPKDASILTAKIESLGMTFTHFQEALRLIEGTIITNGIERPRNRIER